MITLTYVSFASTRTCFETAQEVSFPREVELRRLSCIQEDVCCVLTVHAAKCDKMPRCMNRHLLLALLGRLNQITFNCQRVLHLNKRIRWYLTPNMTGLSRRVWIPRLSGRTFCSLCNEHSCCLFFLFLFYVSVTIAFCLSSKVSEFRYQTTSHEVINWFTWATLSKNITAHFISVRSGRQTQVWKGQQNES